MSQRTNSRAAALAFGGVLLLAIAVIHFLASIQPAERFDRLDMWTDQWITLALCIAALVCSCVGAVKAHRGNPKDNATLIVISVIIAICFLMVAIATIGVLANAEVLFFGGSER